jgi:hypothetical protein
MEITIDSRINKTRCAGSVCTIICHVLSNNEICTSIGAMNYNSGPQDHAASIDYRYYNIRLIIYGDAVLEIRNCKSEEEVEEVFFKMLLTNITKYQFLCLLDEIRSNGIKIGQKDIRDKFKELLKL